MLERERLAVQAVGHHRVVGGGFLERRVRRVAVGGLEDHEARLRLDLGLLGERRDLDALPQTADQRPAGDAVDVGFLLGLRELEQAGVVDLERRLDQAVNPQLEVADLAVAFGAAHRAQLVEHALAGGQPRAAIGPDLGAGLLREVVPCEPDQRTAERHEHGPDRRGLHELAAVPCFLQLGIAVEIGSARVAHKASLRRSGRSMRAARPDVASTLYVPHWLRASGAAGPRRGVNIKYLE